MYQDCLSPPDNAEICNKFIAVERSKMITIVLVKWAVKWLISRIDF